MKEVDGGLGIRMGFADTSVAKGVGGEEQLLPFQQRRTIHPAYIHVACFLKYACEADGRVDGFMLRFMPKNADLPHSAMAA